MATQPLTSHDVDKMDYSSFVGFIRERNRPSGGIRTVQQVAVQCRLTPATRVLEIGSNTGFTSVNLALLTGATVVGIDVNPDSVAEATKYAAAHGVSDRVEFRLGDGRALDLSDGEFDAVWVSNVTSFVSDKHELLRECIRVLRHGGTLIAVPIYYRSQPPRRLVSMVSEAIGTEITVMTKADWRGFFEAAVVPGCELELYYEADFCYERRSEQDVSDYCDTLTAKEHLHALDGDVRAATRRRLEYFMSLFNENLSFAGFSIQLFQKRAGRDEIELFVTRRLPDEIEVAGA